MTNNIDIIMSLNIQIYNLELRFHPDELDFPCSNEYNDLINSDNKYIHPVYYNIDDIYLYYGKKYYSVTYFIYYKINHSIGMNSWFPNNKNFGYHEKDKEAVKILYNFDTGKPEYVFFSAHQQEGKYFPFEKCNFIDNNLIVYPALYSHSNHPYPGVYWRIFGFANDYCSTKGRRIRPTLIKSNDVKYKTQNREVYDKTWYSFFLPLYTNRTNELKQKQQIEEEKNNSNIN